MACRKARELGYPHELWTTRLLAAHARQDGPAAGDPSLGRLAQGTVRKILAEQEVKPHKVLYYLEQRDPEFDRKMVQILLSTGKWRCFGRRGRRTRVKTAPSRSPTPVDGLGR